MTFPRLYAIIDAACFASASDPTSAMAAYARELLAGGVTLIQYRNKSGNAREMLSQARELRRVVSASGVFRRGTASAVPQQTAADQRLQPPRGEASTADAVTTSSVRLIMNDRTDLCLAAEFDGVHVGQDDLSPASVRSIVGVHRWVGVSTHSPEQVREADAWPVDYIAVGPVFATTSKANPDPVIGLEGVSIARSLTSKPLVAIGGTNRENCRDVIAAGADSIAVISDLLKNPRSAAETYISLLAAETA